ncbi:RNA methyltransferase [Deinococcus sp. AJ005]|uniref:TrmH family RNA methyltransferase n=1 Tax=Deinococcus sp. AJ005 TaxID=2652443 RepID=UPI00125CD1C1|nr:TrmH family RNA methyltransferase [Deinococcus sp. AJ005]QFP76618.1 RNA methyltransferase [Deinococcus sp. AJ005]
MTPHIIRIHSENADFQLLEALGRNREKRRKHGLLVVEGVRPINLALQHGWTFDALLIPEDTSLSRWGHNVLERAQAARHFLIAPQGYELLTDRNDGSEIMALLRLPSNDLSRLPTSPDGRVVLLDRPGNPGNLGSIVRSCDAFGVGGVGVVGHGVDPYSREAIRASTGSLLAVPVVHFPGPAEVREWLDTVQQRVEGVRVVGTDEHGEQTARAYDFAGFTVLVAGNETSGMSAALRELCDVTLRIDIAGSASSLNVAVATSILLYEMSLSAQARGKL